MARFFSREDYLHVLHGGPWIVLGHYLTVSKWKPNIRSTEQLTLATLVWVKFPGLPIELFDEEVLSGLGDLVSRAIRVDDTTREAYHGRYARVCVKVDLNKPLIPSITVLGKKQLVEYEGLHLICFACGWYGHRDASCAQGGASPQPPPPAAEPAPGAESSRFGPWMLPKTSRH